MIMEKLDLIKTYPNYYKATSKPQLVDLEPYNYLTVQGVSAPEDELFHQSMEKLYAVAYGIKFICKAGDMDFTVPKLEGFWWVESELPYDQVSREEWHWKLMIRMPDFVGESEYERATKSALEKGKLKTGNEIKFEQVHEGKSVQILHIGSYEEEKESLDKLYNFIEESGLSISGHHHEIYISDPRKTPEEKLKTILRYAVK